MSLAVAGSVAAGPNWEGQGRVTAVDPNRSTVTIDHGGVPGLLTASRSEFPVQSRGVLDGVSPGDRVRFTLGAADESHGLLTVVSLVRDGATDTGGLDRRFTSTSIALAILTLAAVTALGVLLWRELQALKRQVIALDHEANLLRGLVADTQDESRQIARALEDAAAVLRVGYVQELRRRLVLASAPATTDPVGDKGGIEARGALVVVQRGRGDLYRAVEGGVAGPDLAVIWDRRRGERRRAGRRPVGHERRRLERRGAPTETWTPLGFQLVPGGTAEVARLARALRSASGERSAPH